MGAAGMSAHHQMLVWPLADGRSCRRFRRRQSPRAALLETLRRQRQQIEGAAYFSASDAPELYALARAVDKADGRRSSFNFRGVRFQIRFGMLRRYVLDPDTGRALIGGSLLFGRGG